MEEDQNSSLEVSKLSDFTHIAMKFQNRQHWTHKKCCCFAYSICCQKIVALGQNLVGKKKIEKIIFQMSLELTRPKSYSEKTPNSNKKDCIEPLKTYNFAKTKHAVHTWRKRI